MTRLVRDAIALMLSIGGGGMVHAAEPPQYNGVFAARNPHSGAYTELERATPAIHTRMRALGFGGASVTEDITGARSSVRFHVGTPMEFVVRSASTDTDPNSSIMFLSLKSAHDGRSFETYSAGGFSGAKNTTAKSAIGFSATRFGNAYFKVSPAQPLPPGEYALLMMTPSAMMMSGSPPAFCFGIDP